MKRPHEVGLHVALIEETSDPRDRGERIWWVGGTGGAPRTAYPNEVSDELAPLVPRCIAPDCPEAGVIGFTPGRRVCPNHRDHLGVVAAPVAPLPAKPTPALDARVGARLGAIAQGFTGEACSGCGSMKMQRSGACSVCRECGASSGCS